MLTLLYTLGMATTDEMIIRIPRTVDDALDSVAPEFMQGTNKASVRVNWALHEFLRDRQASAKAKEEKGEA